MKKTIIIKKKVILTYKENLEVPHILISGYVIAQALRKFCEELFHEDHGVQDRHAVIL